MEVCYFYKNDLDFLELKHRIKRCNKITLDIYSNPVATLYMLT